MSTECYALVRGSVVRVTALDRQGALPPGPVRYAVSKSVARVSIDEVVMTGSREIIRNEENQDRLQINTLDTTIRYVADIRFTHVDPSLLPLIAGVDPVLNANGDVVGIDANTKMPARSFALEVWSKLAGRQALFGGFGLGGFGLGGFGIGSGPPIRRWGYTVFPFLKGGIVSNFSFSNGLVSFTVTKTATQRNPKWNIGPHDLEGTHRRLLTPVSRNGTWRSFVLSTVAPEPTNGIVEYEDVIEGGTPALTTADIVSGGSPVDAGPWTIYGGHP